MDRSDQTSQRAEVEESGDTAPAGRGGPGQERPREPGGTRLTLADLTRAAGVSVRTVRYYIAEGLLPPPVGAGPRSAYTTGHLDRLRLIARLKAAYLPLREIRRRLAGLSDADVRRALEAPPTARDEAPPADTASAYLDRVLGRRTAIAESPALTAPPNAGGEMTNPGLAAMPPLPTEGARFEAARFSAVADPFGPVPPPAEPPAPAPIFGRAYPTSLPADLEPEPGADAVPGAQDEAWRRVPLGDDAELLIRESAYRRRHDRIDWLVRWARKVFG